MKKTTKGKHHNSKSRSATNVDHHVGQKIRDARHKNNMSQTALAQACEITFQQVQKYENGANRVSASRLWQFAAIFSVSIDYFFEGLSTHQFDSKTIKRLESTARDNISRHSKISESDLQLARLIAEHPDQSFVKSAKMTLNAAQTMSK